MSPSVTRSEVVFPCSTRSVVWARRLECSSLLFIVAIGRTKNSHKDPQVSLGLAFFSVSARLTASAIPASRGSRSQLQYVLYGHGLSYGPGLTCKVCPPANRPNVAKSVLVFAFGSAMLRVRVPI